MSQKTDADIFQNFLKKKYSPEGNVVGDFPILWFGDTASKKPRILTIGMQPSADEYVGDRFPAAPLSFSDAYNNYFRKNPNQLYFGWKGGNILWEGLVNLFNASYYDDEEAVIQAIHINIFQYIDSTNDKYPTKFLMESLGRVSETADLTFDQWESKPLIGNWDFAIATEESFKILKEHRFFENIEEISICQYKFNIGRIRNGKPGSRFILCLPVDILLKRSSVEEVQRFYAEIGPILEDQKKLKSLFTLGKIS